MGLLILMFLSSTIIPTTQSQVDNSGIEWVTGDDWRFGSDSIAVDTIITLVVPVKDTLYVYREWYEFRIANDMLVESQQHKDRLIYALVGGEMEIVRREVGIQYFVEQEVVKTEFIEKWKYQKQ